MLQRVCDLCGKPLDDDVFIHPQTGRPQFRSRMHEYKVKRSDGGGWKKIDCHDLCVRMLFGLTTPKPPCLESEQED